MQSVLFTGRDQKSIGLAEYLRPIRYPHVVILKNAYVLRF